MNRRAPLAVLWLSSALALAPATAKAQLVADLSDHLIAITTGFTGTDVLLFGATEGVGDVVVVVRGPDTTETVRRKERIAGVWVNTDSVTFANVPAFYSVASSAEVVDFTTPGLRSRLKIGADNLRLSVVEENVGTDRLAVFESALIRNKTRQGLFPERTGSVAFLGDRLFRTKVSFPANVPIGTYLVEVFVIDDEQVIGAQTTPLVISKIGVGAEIFDFAHNHSALYGIIAIIVAVAAGWLAGAVFRKV